MTNSPPRSLPGFAWEEMPPGPASTWERAPLARFLEDLERLEDATAQFVQVALPDLIEAGLLQHIHLLAARIAQLTSDLLTANGAIAREKGPPR